MVAPAFQQAAALSTAEDIIGAPAQAHIPAISLPYPYRTLACLQWFMRGNRLGQARGDKGGEEESKKGTRDPSPRRVRSDTRGSETRRTRPIAAGIDYIREDDV